MFSNVENLTFMHSNINKVDGNFVMNNNITNVRNNAEIASIQNGIVHVLQYI